MKRLTLLLVLWASVFCAFARGTPDRQDKAPQPQITQYENAEGAPAIFSWYYLDATGIHPTESVKNVPSVAKRPWTEAVRIASASLTADEDLEPPKAYAIVNRVGMIEFSAGGFNIFPDVNIFNNYTADNIVFAENTPYFLLYKNSFFNETVRHSYGELRPFLAQFSPVTHVSSPVMALENLSLSKEAEIVDYVWDGVVWNCCVKTISGERTSFSYISIQPTIPLSNLTPASANNSFLLNGIERDDFRNLKEPADFATAPARLRELLSGVPENIPFYVSCYTAGGQSPRAYTTQKAGDTAVPLVAHSLLAETWAMCLFQDGTTYLQGALYGKPFMNDGNIFAFKLPKLPAGFVYGSAFIIGTTLYAAWEETSFYETGRSGFVAVNLDAFLR